MSELNGKLDRRSLLKLLGSVGTSAAVMSGCGGVLSRADSFDPSATLTGGKFDRTIRLATDGPGGNMDWQNGDSIRFVPPEKIPTSGRESSILASLPKEKLLGIYYRMNASRKWETTMKDLFVGGQDSLYGSFHPYVGEEAVANGVMAALNDDDYIASTHRGHGHLIAKGGDLNKMSAEIFFKETGYNKAYGGSMHITDMSRGIMGMNGIVGASYYLAAGAALRAKVRGTKQIAVAFFGDGASCSPYYFSAIRSSTNYKLPVLFVCENNFQYMAVHMSTYVPTKYISEYTKGLGIPHHLVDGNDVAAVYAATQEATEWARQGKGPSMIEAITYRWYDHSGFAGSKVGRDAAIGLTYRSDDELRAWMSRDPIVRYKTWLTEKDLATPSELAKAEADATAAVEASVAFARQSNFPDPKAGVLNTFCEGPVSATQFYNRSGLA
jgi:acetoin:2,6-dichlorophenolindophenol oxidoreductase subunit alpha